MKYYVEFTSANGSFCENTEAKSMSEALDRAVGQAIAENEGFPIEFHKVTIERKPV